MVLRVSAQARAACLESQREHAFGMNGRESIEKLQREMKERGELDALLSRWAETLSDEDREAALAVLDPDGETRAKIAEEKAAELEG
jgi:hypothetical protein